MAATTSVSPVAMQSAAGGNGLVGVESSLLSPPNHRTNYHGITALMLACQQGQINDVQKIVRQRKQSVKERSRGGKIPLHFCAESGSVQCLEVVLSSMDPDQVNTQDEEGYAPVHLAVINGHKDAVRRLISANVDLNSLDNEKHSLVHWATVCGEVEILDLLLSSGAPASTPDIHMAHPIHYASQMCGSVNGVSGGSRANRVQSTVYGVSPKKGLVILRKLIHHGCPIDVRDKDGRQPLLWAASAAGVHFFRRQFEVHKLVHIPFMFEGSSDGILSLVNAGARVDAEDKDGLTALHCAASRGHTDCLETLIGLCGAEVDIIDNNGCTALFYAVTLGNADCTELLLNYGAEPNRQDRKGRTPAHCGAAKGQLETLKLLAKHEANLWLRNVRGDLPLHEAVLSRRRDLVLWLLSQRPDTVNASNNDGRCPIHLAALNNNVEMVKILIDHSADVNILMRSGKGAPITPLDAAIHKGNSAVAKFLQLHGGLPSNSLNDASLQRRLNRSIDSHRSPGSGMQSQLGSHHDPSPEDPHRAFISPEAFDTPIPPPTGADNIAMKNGGGAKKSSSSVGPFVATSTPIMDDSVQTDPISPSVRDMHVQVSDDLGVEESGGSTTSSHRKSRRRRNKSPVVSRSGSSSPDERAKTSRASKKSSRRSSRRSEFVSGSNRPSEDRDLAEMLKEKKKSRSTSREKTGEESPLKDAGSSDALLDTTLVDENFTELENVAVQSSETDAREEDLGSGDDANIDRNQMPKSKTPTKEKVSEEEKENKKEDDSPTRPDSRKDSILKSRNNSAKKTCVSWQDETGAEKGEIEEGTEKTDGDGGNEETKSDQSKEEEEEENVAIFEKVEKRPSEVDEAITEKPDEPTERPEESTILDEIEMGKSINLQEAAAARRQSRQSKSISRERSVDLSDASSRSAHKSCFDKPSRSKNNSSSNNTNIKNARSPARPNRVPTTSEEREIFLQEQILAGKRVGAKPGAGARGGGGGKLGLGSRRSSRGDDTGGDFLRDSGFSDQTLMTNNSGSEEHAKGTKTTSSSLSMIKRRYNSTSTISSQRRPPSTSNQMKRKSIFSSSAKKIKPRRDPNRFNDSVTVNQIMLQQQQAEMMMLAAAAAGLDGDDSSSTRGESITSGDDYLDQDRRNNRRKGPGGGLRPKSKLGAYGGRNDDLSPRVIRKSTDVDTPISVTQAMQASMRKYNFERAIFQQLLELKRLQIRAGKANEQILVKRLADGYKKAGLAVNFREYSGPFTFKNFEKYLYDQLRLLQANRKLIPRFAPSDDLEKLSMALKKMNATKLPYLEDEDRSASCCSHHNGDTPVNGTHNCTHSTHRCHHAAHAYTGVPCAAYIGKGRKPTFLPKVNPLRAPGPTQTDHMTRNSVMGGGGQSIAPTPASKVSPMQISISPRNDTQSPITLEVQQGQSTQVFTLPTQTLDPTKNYYVSLSIKPNGNKGNNPQKGNGGGATANKYNFHGGNSPNRLKGGSGAITSVPRDNPGDLDDDGSISAPPPPAENDPDLNEFDRDKHNQSM